jgi:MFS family permease
MPFLFLLIRSIIRFNRFLRGRFLQNPNTRHSNRNNEFSRSQIFLIVAGSFLALFAIGLILSGFGVFFKPISTQFGWTRAEVSLAASIASVISGLVGIPVGKLADRFSPRLVTLITSAIGGGACLLLSRMTSILELYLYYGILVGITMTNVIPIVALMTRCFDRQRGWIMGMALAGGSMGSIAAPPLATKLIDSYNWNFAYLIMGIIVLVLTVIAVVFLKDPLKRTPLSRLKNAPSPGQRTEEKAASLGQAFRTGVFWILVVLILCCTIAQQAIVVHLIPHATDIGISPIIAAGVVSVIYIVNTIGNLTGGKVFDKIGSGISIISGVSLLLIACLILIFASQVWLFYVFAILFGMAWGSIITLRFSMIAELFGSKALGSITGAFMLICNIGGAASPVVIGHIFDITGSYKNGFLLISGIVFIALLMAILLKVRKDRPASFKVN